MSDFQPISLVGSLYRLVAKVMAKILRVVMDKLITPYQSYFLKGRLLVDGVVKINQLVDLAKHSIKVFLIFKVDFEKYGDFLHCNIESNPFWYLGFLVRDNPWLKSIWDPLVNLMWKNLILRNTSMLA